MKKVFLEKNWVLKGEKIGTLAASVPGCVHTDLMNHGIIKDLYWRDNKLQYDWIEDCDFTYSCTFDAESTSDAVLVFEGLDTYCDIYLNNKKIGSADDMFIPYRFDVDGILKLQDNVLRVDFRSPVKEVADKPELVGAFTVERLHTRRVQCTYGWDWVDRFVTCGIFRPVYLEYGKDIHVNSAYVLTESVDKYSAQLCVELEVENYNCGGLLQLDIVSPQGDVIYNSEIYCEEPKVVRRIDIQDPQLWYPAGYGEQPLYTLSVTVNDNAFTQVFGIRTIKVLQLPDKEGDDYYLRCKELQKGISGVEFDHNESYSGFQVLVNGKKILCRGGNWVPCEPFPSAETKEKFDRLISLAVEMRVNMIRVWGGGLFENSYFYDLCDRAGILVTQDFLMACGSYPEKEEWFIDRLQKEAAFAVKYLRNHPCLAWWSGDNENAVEGNDKQQDYKGRASALKGIAPYIYADDRGRAFFPSSPYGGDCYASVTVGTAHNTNFVGHTFDYFHGQECDDYKEYFGKMTARFIAEEPVFGAVSRNSALRFMTEEDIVSQGEEMLIFHTKNNPCLERNMYYDITDFALKVFGKAENGIDRYFKYKYIQYEWARVVFESLRNNIGFCNGLVFWMFNDCWPAALGWSFVDYYCMPKAGFYAFRRCSKHVTVAVTEDNGYNAVISNDLEEDTAVKGCAYLFKRSGGMSVCDTFEFSTTAKGYSATKVELPWKTDEENVVVCDIITENGENDRSFYKSGKLEISDCSNKIKVVSRTENSITVTTDSYIHALELEGDYVFSDNYFSLLAGEEKTVTWKYLGDKSTDDFTLTAYTLK